MIREGVKVASFALAPKKELIAKLKDAGLVTMPSVGARRHAEKVAGWGADAVMIQGGEGGGHTGSVPTTLLLPQVHRRGRHPCGRRGRFLRRSRSGRRAGLRRQRHRHGHPLPAHQRQQRQQRGERGLPRHRRQRHDRHHRGRWHAAPGAAYRAGRQAGEGQPGRAFATGGPQRPRFPEGERHHMDPAC